MCGLIGFCGYEQVAPALLEGMKRLEYRGYDSAGMATIDHGKMWVRKDAGHLPEVEAKQHLSKMPGTVGIGHVRWATHGEVNQKNAHPQVDCRNEIAVVHNGIIENHSELSSRLSPNHKFVSTSDTENIPHLIEQHMHTGISFMQAVSLTTKDIKGPYAFLAISTHDPDFIIAACKDVPMLVASGKRGTFVSSDANSFPAEYTQLCYLDDGEVAVIHPQRLTVFDASGKEIQKETFEIPRRKSVAPDNNGHHMLTEIYEQPWAIGQALLQNKETLNRAVLDILRAGQLIITACGTSRHAALLGRYMMSHIGKKLSEVVTGSEFKYFLDSLSRNSLVIAVSQSGETADVLDGVNGAKSVGAEILSIVNRVNSQLARKSDIVLPLGSGEEIGVAATKTFEAELVVFYLLAFSMANQLDWITGQLRDISQLIQNNLEGDANQAQRLAERLRAAKDCYFIARGSNLHIATEAALKLKEIAYIHSEGMPAGELKHGTLALIEKGTPVFSICPHDYTFSDTMANAEEAKARGAYLIGVSDSKENVFDEWIKLPVVDEILYPLVTIAPLQLFAYYSAVVRGLDPDRPRNLAKSVTVP